MPINGLKMRATTDKAAEILIYEDIGAGWFSEGITAKSFLTELRALGKLERIDVRINSAGGSVFDGLAIYNALRQHPAKVTVHVDGIAASIASVIAMAGQEIRMGEGAFVMIHDPFTMAAGNADSLREVADRLDAVKDELLDIYAARTGREHDEIAAWMKAETWFDAKDAMEFGFADVRSDAAIAAHADVSRFTHLPPALQPQARAAASQPGPTAASETVAAKPASQPRKETTMNVMEQLRARAAEHQSAAAAIREKCSTDQRDPTQAEREVIKSHLDAFDAIQADLGLQERLESAEGIMASSQGRKVQPDGLQNTLLPTSGEKARHGFDNFGGFARSVKNAVLRPGEMDPRLVRGAAASSYGTEGTGPDGGFAVPPQYAEGIMSMIMGESSLFAACDTIPLSSNRFIATTDETTAWQSSGGVLTYWGGEAGTLTQSKPALKEFQVSVDKLYALVPVTDELLEDAPALGNFLTRKAGEKLTFALNNAILNGTGVGQPVGILSAGCTVSVAKESSQGAATVVATNLIKMATRMPPESFARAAWIVSQDTIQEIWQLNLTFRDRVGSAGIAAGARMPTISLPGENGSTFSTIMGRPVIVSMACQTLGTVGDIYLADLKGYCAPFKSGGVRGDVSIHLWFDQGITAFRWTMRVGGKPWLSAAISPLNGSNTLSPFVTLATR